MRTGGRESISILLSNNKPVLTARAGLDQVRKHIILTLVDVGLSKALTNTTVQTTALSGWGATHLRVHAVLLWKLFSFSTQWSGATVELSALIYFGIRSTVMLPTAVSRKRSWQFFLSASGSLQLKTYVPYVRGFEQTHAVNQCIVVVWYIQNVRWDGSSFTWHHAAMQQSNNAVSINTPRRWIFKRKEKKCCVN